VEAHFLLHAGHASGAIEAAVTIAGVALSLGGLLVFALSLRR
jgi:hypothetical protein